MHDMELGDKVLAVDVYKRQLILIVAAIFVVWWNPAEKLSYDSVDEVYYKEYMDKYYGCLLYTSCPHPQQVFYVKLSETPDEFDILRRQENEAIALD